MVKNQKDEFDTPSCEEIGGYGHEDIPDLLALLAAFGEDA